jgi:hypothetical protein
MKNVTLYQIVPAAKGLCQGLTKYEKGLKHRMNDVFVVLDSNGESAVNGVSPLPFLRSFSGHLAES